MSLCKECGLEIEWRRQSVKGKRDHLQCFNLDGSVHWDLCSKTKFERIKRTGTKFEGKRQDGYITPFKPSGVQLIRDAAPVIVGTKLSGKCRGCCPPWEICADCPDAIKSVA